MTQRTEFDGFMFETDSLSDRFKHAVFPLFEDESIFFARHLVVKPEDTVLDIGTGSGILAIAAAKRGAKVTACDINPRALEFAQRNAIHNGVDNNIQFVLSDVYSSIEGKFDVILANPPFNPAPPDGRGKISSVAGIDGLAVIRKIFAGCADHLNTNGTLQMTAFSLGKNGTPLLFDVLNSHMGNLDPHATYTHLYPPDQHNKIKYFERIFGDDADKQWLEYIQQFPEIYYMFATVNMNAQQPGFFEHTLNTNFEELEFSGNRDARIRRLQSLLMFMPK